MSKIVVLNSGGFDSITLLRSVVAEHEKDEVHSLHFNYGERNQKQQLECVNKVCERLNIPNICIELPPISWTSRDFYKESNNYGSQYLEYRNLIFLSYALSYAESIGAEKIYLATLKGLHYPDTSEVFFEGLNHFSKPLSNIEVVAPFSQYEKIDLVYYANKYGVGLDEFFSCDTPNSEGEPCGECADCKDIEVLNKILTIDHPHKALVMNGFNYTDPEFIRLSREQKVREVRLLINNDCQLKCSHCFYGFEDTKSPILSNEELYEVVLEAEELGIENIHFSGKEPLYDDSIVWFAKKMFEDNLNITFDIVTNGVNIPKYAQDLKRYGLKKFYLSVDDVLDSNGIRSVHGVTDRALRVCCAENIEVEIFIDLHENNYNKVYDIVSYLSDTYPCVSSFYIRTIRNIGSAKDMDLLPVKYLEQTFLDIVKSAKTYTDKEFNMNIGIEYEHSIYRGGEDNIFIDVLDTQDLMFTTLILPNFHMVLEDRCYRYEFQITITPDGYALGCGSEVSCENYDETSVGNIRDYSLKELIERGKDIVTGTCNKNYCNNGCKKCSFLY